MKATIVLKALLLSCLLSDLLYADPAGFYVIAHRGGVVMEGAPRPNIGMLPLAVERGYQMVELDVRQTIDHHLVVYHDKTLNKYFPENCTQITGECSVVALTWDKLKGFRSDRGFVVDGLDAYLVATNRLGLAVMLDMKDDKLSQKAMDNLIAILDKHDMNNAKTYSIGSIDTKFDLIKQTRVSVSVNLALAGGIGVDKARTFIFEHGRDLDRNGVRKAQRLGMNLVASINWGHYADIVGTDKQSAAAVADVARLKQFGCPSFQIDSDFDSPFFGHR